MRITVSLLHLGSNSPLHGSCDLSFSDLHLDMDLLRDHLVVISHRKPHLPILLAKILTFYSSGPPPGQGWVDFTVLTSTLDSRSGLIDQLWTSPRPSSVRNIAPMLNLTFSDSLPFRQASRGFPGQQYHQQHSQPPPPPQQQYHAGYNPSYSSPAPPPPPNMSSRPYGTPSELKTRVDVTDRL